MNPASRIETAAALLAAFNAMSSRYEVADHEEWRLVELASDSIIELLEALGFEQGVDFGDDGLGGLVLFH